MCDFVATCLIAVEMSATMTAKLQDDMNSIPLADDDPQGRNFRIIYFTTFLSGFSLLPTLINES